ncbi:hypothetical protein CPB84DRAFT_1792223 [Gymnopilus junonius]|uniref:Uncharacterized protein n=1 Tax=Gymnopilus junonius TaxID=109634 RepID=A0A9P5TIZ7_GYMJU|nr:hypothetical protein CPB84DRAFT_1792223 [Gymnopilus junonius]
MSNKVGHIFHCRSFGVQDLDRAVLAYRSAVKLAHHKYLLEITSRVKASLLCMADIDWQGLASEFRDKREPWEDLDNLNDLIYQSRRFVIGHDSLPCVKNLSLSNIIFTISDIACNVDFSAQAIRNMGSCDPFFCSGYNLQMCWPALQPGSLEDAG